MSSWYTRQLINTAVVWSSGISDGYGGWVYGDPSEIDCRWDEGKNEKSTPTAEEEVPSTLIWTDSPLIIGDYVYLGELADLTQTQKDDPQTISTARRVKRTAKVSSVTGNLTVYKAWL